MRDRFAGVDDQMINSAATQFLFDILLIQMHASAMRDKGTSCFRFLRAEKAAPTQVRFGRVTQLQDYTIVLLPHAFERRHGSVIVEIAEHNEQRTAVERRNKFSNATHERGGLVESKMSQLMQPFEDPILRKAWLDPEVSAAHSHDTDWADAIQAGQGQAAGDV